MASLEELCKSITEQLQSFDQRNSKLRRVLQAENNALRTKLARLVQAEIPDTPAGDAQMSATNEQGWQPSWRTTAAVESPRRNSACGVSSVGNLNTPRLNMLQVELPPCSDLTNPPMTPRAEDDKESMDSDDIVHRNSRGSIFSFGEGTENLEGVWLKWHKVISTMMNMSLLGVERSKIESALLLRPAWETTKFDRPMGRRTSVSTWLTNSSVRSSALFSMEREGMGPLSMRASKYSKYVLHPDCRLVTTWSLLGAIMILYDVLTFPLAGFDLKESDFALAVMWITTLFWTSDIILTFLRGVHYRGVIEMRPSRILWLYAKSWFFIDLTMVTIDWFVLYMTSGGDASIAGASKVLRSGKALRAARVVRAIRLIRTIKVLAYLRDVFENIKSEYYQLMIKLFASILGILVLSHYVTCTWFAQAHFSSMERTWITVFLGDDPRPPFAEEYATSMHFSLTQLAGSQNIVPQNAQERFVASVIIVFDIVIFSTLVGIITDIMAHFRSLTYERSREVNLIRKFFARSEIPPILETRIWHFFRRHYRSRNRCVNECEIEFFRYLPSSLKMDLHQHLYIPVLADHTLFGCILRHDRYSLLAVCVTALTSANLVHETEVFAEGDIAKFMFFVTTGIMNYKARQFGIESKADEGMWVAEASLWTKWMHCGRLTAEGNCEVLKVDADMFEKTIYERAEIAEWFRGLRKYAALFAQRVSDSFDTARPVTDVDRNLDGMLESIVEKSFFYMAPLVASNESLDKPSPGKVHAEEDFFFSPLAATLKKAMSSLSVLSVGQRSAGGTEIVASGEQHIAVVEQGRRPSVQGTPSDSAMQGRRHSLSGKDEEKSLEYARRLSERGEGIQDQGKRTAAKNGQMDLYDFMED